MTDPKRLAEQSSSRFELDLLGAGRLDAMPEQSASSILAGLGLAPSSAVAATSSSGKFAFLKSAFVKGSLVVGAVGAVGVWGVQQWAGDAAPLHSSRRTEADVPLTQPPQEAALAVQAFERKEPETLQSAEPETHEAQLNPPKPEAGSRRRGARVDTLPLELEAIDAARGALAQGDPVLTLRLLDKYAAQFPKPRLQAEATLLRVAALVNSGELTMAKRLGEAFLEKQPNSPYARRVRSLIGESLRKAKRDVLDGK